ncbi:MAG TPA: formyltransferase family protein [Gemmatimonadales bacterium]|nr:formyltransferase family protein [Gemmatimonadales bacterium]
MNIVLAAEEAAGVQALRAVADAGHRVVGVLTSSAAAASGAARRGAVVADVAADLGVPVWPAHLVRSPELAAVLCDGVVDLLLNVHSLHIVHPAVLRAAVIGSFNLHPGPLPRYAGLNAPSWAVLHGEIDHAVTVHWMAPGIDTGPVAYATTFALTEEDTGLSVSARCVRLGIPLLRRLLDDAAVNPRRIPVLEQNPSERRYHGREVPYAGKVRWSLPAGELTRFIRACDFHPLPSPWGSPLASLGGEPLAVLGASLTREPCAAPPGTVGGCVNGAALVATGDEWVRLHHVRVGGRRVEAGRVLAPGQRLSDGP